MGSNKYNIDEDGWALADKVFYGGLGYGAFCLPTDFFKVIIAIIFPPLGEVINIVEDSVSDSFPWITWDSLKKLCSFSNLNKIVYSFLLTTLFYIPGLVYTLTNIVNKERKVSYEPIEEQSSPFANVNANAKGLKANANAKGLKDKTNIGKLF